MKTRPGLRSPRRARSSPSAPSRSSPTTGSPCAAAPRASSAGARCSRGALPSASSATGKRSPSSRMAHVMRPGDWRSGYYRDQTVMMAVGADDARAVLRAALRRRRCRRDEPFSGGRQMSNHFATRIVDEQGHWRDLLGAVQVRVRLLAGRRAHAAVGRPRLGVEAVPRIAGRCATSRSGFSRNGDEVCFATIGNAAAAEGLFWESRERGRRPAGPDADQRVGRRIRHLGARTSSR